jgi:hypothetical protein
VIAPIVNPERPRSARVGLARLAEAVIAAEPQVAPTTGLGGRWLTLDGGERIEGVVAAEDGDGTVEVELHLIARWPTGPLPQVAADLRRALRAAAREAGLDSRLGAVSVSFHDLDLGGPGAVR